MSAVVLESFSWEVAGDSDRIIRGKVVRPDDHQGRLPHILILHGFKGFMDWGFFPELARAFAQQGIAAVLFNMSGSGIGVNPMEFTEHEAFAANTHTRELEDVEFVRAQLRAGRLGQIDPDRSALFGHSRGGGAALIHAAEDGDYAAVTTWASVDTFDRFDEPTKAHWRAEGCIWIPNARTAQEHRMDVGLLEDLERNKDRLDPVAACSRLQTPALLIHGGADEAVEVEAVERLADAIPAGGRTLIIDGAGHTFGMGHPFGEPTSAWLQALAATLDHTLGHLGGV